MPLMAYVGKPVLLISCFFLGDLTDVKENCTAFIYSSLPWTKLSSSWQNCVI